MQVNRVKAATEPSKFLHLGDDNYCIRKRDSKIVPFDQERITQAIVKAMRAVGLEDVDEAIRCSNEVCDSVVKQFHRRSIPAVEQIQDIVEETLIQRGHAKTVRAYILYREQHARIRDTKNLLLDIRNTMDGYLNQQDWRVRENSNVNYSLGGLILHNSGAVTANYWLNHIYTRDIAQAHRNGTMHIHDLSMFSGYCAGWSLRQLLLEGLGGVPNKISSLPARHLSTLVAQMVNFLGVLQNEWAGAQAFSSFDTYLAPFVRHDKITYRDVKQNIQSFIFGVNTPSRWGSQAPFTNITLDWVVPNDLKDEPVIIGGKPQQTCYGDYQKEMDWINRAFLEVMMEGDAASRGFPYPIPTYNITPEFDWDSENAELLFGMTAKYGTPYFQNFLNSDLKPGDVRSMCCRLQLDKRELKKKGGGLFGAAELTGSIGVVTINLPRIGFLSRSREEFDGRLAHVMDMARDSLEIKRRVITRLMGEGLFPYSKRYLGTWDNHFSTIGLVGMNECCRNLNDTDLTSQEGREFALSVLDTMRERLISYQESTGNLYNLEATPAESTSYRLAKIDKERFPGILTAGKDDPYYTNSTQLPVEHTADLFRALDIQEELQMKYTGGTVFHCFLGESIEDTEACKKLVRSVAESYRVPYYTISPTFSVCTDHGYLKGEQQVCSHCGKETEVYARIVGYYRPVKNWNKGKAEEYRARQMFQVRLDGRDAAEGAVKPEPVKLPERTAEKGAGLPGKGVLSIPVFELEAARKDRSSRPRNGSSDWKLFTKPSCRMCEQAREELTASNLSTEIYDLQEATGRKLFTLYYRQIRKRLQRNTNGEMDLPILLKVDKEGQVLGWAAGLQEIQQLLHRDRACPPC
ncbi:MAG: ribonucleoside triphosphate reductase [bacterium]